MRAIVGGCFSLVLASCGGGSVVAELEKYALEVSLATEGAVSFVSVSQTTATPVVAFVIAFSTDREELMSRGGAEPGNEAYLINRGRTSAWSARFCTPQLKSVMARYAIDMVTGTLTDPAGEIQSVAPCMTGSACCRLTNGCS